MQQARGGLREAFDDLGLAIASGYRICDRLEVIPIACTRMHCKR